MDRREFIGGVAKAGGVAAATALGMSGLSEKSAPCVAEVKAILGGQATDFDFQTMDATVWAREFVARFGGDEELMRGWFANSIMAGYDEAMRRRDKAYDPIAVLEAMREREVGFAVSYGGGEWATMWYGELMGQQFMDEDHGFKTFVDAVKYLHGRAAAVDAEFAKAFPVPDGE